MTNSVANLSFSQRPPTGAATVIFQPTPNQTGGSNIIYQPTSYVSTSQTGPHPVVLYPQPSGLGTSIVLQAVPSTHATHPMSVPGIRIQPIPAQQISVYPTGLPPADRPYQGNHTSGVVEFQQGAGVGGEGTKNFKRQGQQQQTKAVYTPPAQRQWTVSNRTTCFKTNMC